jgi:hypothetical protein
LLPNPGGSGFHRVASSRFEHCRSHLSWPWCPGSAWKCRRRWSHSARC